MYGTEKQVRYASGLVKTFFAKLDDVVLETIDRNPENVNTILETLWRLRDSIQEDLIAGNAGELIEEFQNMSEYSVNAVKEILSGRIRSGRVQFGGAR